MFLTYLKNMWQKFLKFLICLLVFLMPLFWLPFTYEAFEFNKSYLLFFLAAAGLLAWLARMVFEDKKVRFKKGPLDLFVIVFLAVLVLNALFSVDKTSTLLGFYGRFWPNLIGLLSLIIFYFLLSNNAEIENADKKSITISGITKTFLWSSFLVLLTAYFSLFGVWGELGKILKLPAVMSLKTFNTVGGSFEQLSIYLAVVFVFLVISLAFREFHKLSGEAEGERKRQSRRRYFPQYFLLAAIFLFLVLTGSWQSWFIIFFSLLLFLVFSFWKRIFREDVSRLSLTTLFIIISAIFLFRNPVGGLLRQIKIFSNIPQEVQLSQNVSWATSFKALKENPLLGVGVGNFNYAFSKYKPQSFMRSPWWYIRFDRPANHFSEILSTEGILGILADLVLLGMFFVVSWFVLSAKTTEKESKIQWQAPLIFSFVAVLAGQFVFYQNITLAFLFWLFLALGVISWGKPQKEKIFAFKELPELGLIITVLFWSALVGIGVFSFVLVKGFVADIYYRRFLVDPSADVAKIEMAVKLADKRADYHIALAGRYLGLISEELAKPQPDNQKVINLVALSIREGRRATEVSPKNIGAQQALGIVYREVQGVAQGALEWGIKTFRSALETEPKNPALYVELGKLLLADNKKDEARVLFEKALQLREDYVPAGIQLSVLDEADGKIEEATKRMEDLVVKNPFSIDAHFQLGRLYYNANRYNEAISQFESVLAIFPNHSNSLYSLGLIYEARGQKTKALEQFRKVLDLNPGNKTIIEKIQSLTAEAQKSAEEVKEEKMPAAKKK